MPDPDRITLEERRHAELLEKLDKIALGVESLHEQGERRLLAQASIEAKLESALRYFVLAWQASEDAD